MCPGRGSARSRRCHLASEAAAAAAGGGGGGGAHRPRGFPAHAARLRPPFTRGAASAPAVSSPPGGSGAQGKVPLPSGEGRPCPPRGRAAPPSHRPPPQPRRCPSCPFPRPRRGSLPAPCSGVGRPRRDSGCRTPGPGGAAAVGRAGRSRRAGETWLKTFPGSSVSARVKACGARWKSCC